VQRYTAKQGTKHISSNLSPVLEILIESSALYAASLFIFVVLLAMKSPNQSYIQDIHAQIAVCPVFILISVKSAHSIQQGIAPTLLVLRISAGHARKDEEWSAPSSGLRFASTADASSTSGVALEGKRDSLSDGYTSAPSSNTLNKVQKVEEEIDE
jgi:hypothetical protein